MNNHATHSTTHLHPPVLYVHRKREQLTQFLPCCRMLLLLLLLLLLLPLLEF
jgi:hypothetical protein